MNAPRDRVPRRLEIKAELAALLAHLAGREGRAAAGHVDLGALFAVETSIGHAFSDDLLAAFALDLPSLRASHRFSLGAIVGHCGRLRDRRLRGDLIGLAGDGEVDYVVDKRTAKAGATVILVIDAEAAPGAPSERIALAEFLRRAIGSPLADIDPGLRFAAILHRPPPMATAPGRPVIHASFGRGTAFSEKGDGPNRKVTCDFPGVGLKIIAARFLRFDDGIE